MSTQVGVLSTQRSRWAVAGMFFANGFIIGGWAPQIPVVMQRLGITEFQMSLLILALGIGAITAMLSSGYIIARYGSRASLRFFAVAIIPALPLVTLADTPILVGAAMAYLGGTLGAMDVSMNSNAVAVERHLDRAIMSSSHGFWSLGGFFGGSIGGYMIQQFGPVTHALIVSGLAALLIAWSWRDLVTDVNHSEDQPSTTFSWPRNPMIYVIGLLALLCMNSEGAVLDWAAIYLNKEMGAPLATASMAFAGFSGAMAIMRFVGDGIRNRYGAVRTFRVSGIIAAAGMLAAGLSPWPWLTIAAFSICGIGVANMVPILFSAAGNQPGTSAGAGMSLVTTMGYCGILVAPPLIGSIGGWIGFAPVYIAVALLLGVAVMMANLTGSADRTG